MPLPPHPEVVHPVPGAERVVFLRPLVTAPNIEVGEYTYYDDPERPEEFETRNVLYGFGPERLVIGRYCALAEGVRFLMAAGNHPMLGPSTFPFGIFGGEWAAQTGDLVRAYDSRGDTVVGSDVWLGYRSVVMPGVKIGHGAIVAACSVVVGDVPPYAVVGGNPSRVLRIRFPEDEVAALLRAAWWDWPAELVTRHARTIMSGSAAELETIATRERLPRRVTG
jgi:virginiamycin A acetyltransferase